MKRVIEDLTLLAQRELEGEVDEPNALDYVEHWITNGGTLRGLATKLQADSQNVGFPYDPPLEGGGLGRMIRRKFGDEAAEDRLARARARGATAMVEETHDIADAPVLGSEDAARARNRIGTRQWAATAYDRNQFGQNKGNSVAVNVNLGIAHLDAMRNLRVEKQPLVSADVQVEQLGSAAGVEDAELIEDGEQLSLLPSST
ncbi:MAG TPA: hypothetical protein VIR54_03350 [Vicinamibacterales bacterium]